MQYKNALLILGLATFNAITAQEFDNNDVPSQCRSVCQAMVDAARTCDNTVDGDREEANCICNTSGASTQLPECAACIRQFDDSDDEQNDVDEVVSSCGFSSTTFNAAAATSAISGRNSNSISGTAATSASRSLITSVYTTTSTDFDDDPNDQDETETRTRTTVFPADASQTASSISQTSGAVDSVTSSGGAVVGAATSNANGAASSATSAAGGAVTDSGAKATALPMLGAGAGMIAAVLGLL